VKVTEVQPHELGAKVLVSCPICGVQAGEAVALWKDLRAAWHAVGLDLVAHMNEFHREGS
jgi:hypothetical protein